MHNSHPDVVFLGGLAYSAGWGAPEALGVAVKDGKITAIAPDATIKQSVGTATRVVDLAGRLVMPGFQDAHAHPVMGGLELLQCNLTSAHSATEALDIVAAYSQAHPERPWIVGGGWSMSSFPGGTPLAADLDRIVPDRPVFLMNRDHHGAWVNSKALEIAGITRDTPDPADGRIERDAHGNPNGTLHEGAAELVRVLTPSVSIDEAVAGLAAGQEFMFSHGVTAWADAWVGRTGGMDNILHVYEEALAREVLKARITAALWWERDGGLAQLETMRADRHRVASLGRGDVLRADTVKIMVDGVAENYTAAMSKPYKDAHGHPTSNAGLTFVGQEELVQAALAIEAAGMELHLHTLGDRAVTLGLDAIEEVRKVYGRRPGSRPTLAHLQVVAASDIPRFEKLGAIANLQMLWAAVDEQLDELTFPFLEPELIERHYPFGDLLRAGAPLACGSDWPVSTPNPWEAIAVGLTRALPGREADPRIGLNQRLDLATMLDAYTAGSAAAGGRAEHTGLLEPGYAADLVVLEDNPFSLDADALARLKTSQTWVDGKQVWQA